MPGAAPRSRALPPSLRAHARRYTGLLAASRGDPVAGADQLDAAISTLSELGYRYEMACALLERGEILLGTDRGEEGITAMREADHVFAELGAKPMHERAQQALAARAEPGEGRVASAASG